MDPLALVCAALVLVIPIALLIGALVLRASVWLANRCLWAPPKRARASEADEAEDEFAGLFAVPTRGTAVRPLSLGHALGLSFACALVHTSAAVVHVSFETHAGVRGTERLALAGFLALVAFVGTACVCAILLPTTFGRACLVTLFSVLISAAVVVAVGAPMFLLLG